MKSSTRRSTDEVLGHEVSARCTQNPLVFALAANSFADVNILVIGSTHSFSEDEADGAPFHVEAVADRLRDIVAKDAKISGTKNVVFEDIYRKKSLETAIGGGGKMMDMEYRCYTLARCFVWPEERAERLRNLRGEGKTKWDCQKYLLTTW